MDGSDQAMLAELRALNETLTAIRRRVDVALGALAIVIIFVAIAAITLLATSAKVSQQLGI